MGMMARARQLVDGDRLFADERLVVGHSWGTSRTLTMALFALVFVSAGLPSMVRVAAGAAVGAAAASRATSPAAVRWIVVLGVCYLTQQVGTPARDACARMLGRRLSVQSTAWLMDAALVPAGIAHLEDSAINDRRAQARGTLLGYTPGTAIAGMAEKATTRMAGLAAAAVVARVSWILAVLLIVAWRVLRRPLLQGLLDSYRV